MYVHCHRPSQRTDCHRRESQSRCSVFRLQTSRQGAVNLARNVQLLLNNDIPPDIEALYNENKQLGHATVFDLLTSCSQQFSTIYAVFNAVDESKETYHSELLDFFVHLQSLHCKILISGRPGSPLSGIRSKLQSHTIEVRANEYDLETYVCSRVHEGRIQNKCLKLIQKVDGM
jgi:hypothetical protein